MTDRELMQESLIALRSCSGAPHWPALQPIVTALRERLAQPVGWLPLDGRGGYTAPPSRQPLTDQVIQELADEGVFHANVFEIVRRIEEEHGIFMLRAHKIGGEE